jgi:signal transduction histidine kinase
MRAIVSDWLSQLSWRLRIPLAIVAVIVLTELVVTFAMAERAKANARADLENAAQVLSGVLARTLRDPLLRDDLWQAFEVVRTPLTIANATNPLLSVIVLDPSDEVFVSSDPERIPLQMPSAKLPEFLHSLAMRSRADFPFVQSTGIGPAGREVAARQTVLAEDGTYLGQVILEFDAELYQKRVRDAIQGVAWLTIPGLLILIPLGWFLGHRLASPLSALARAIGRVGVDPPQLIAASLKSDSRTLRAGAEVALLSQSTQSMLDALAKQNALEAQMLAAERLAAVGRIAASIAHEVNNPVAGMLTAIDTATVHGKPDALTARTLKLLERGLMQIRTVVGALLIEAKSNARRLSLEDFDDLRALTEPEAAQQQVVLEWKVELHNACGLDLPAQPVRQIALNLLLNGLKAASRTEPDKRPGKLILKATVDQASLYVEVSNTGPPMPEELIHRLHHDETDHIEGTDFEVRGLGLWISKYLAIKLQGRLTAVNTTTHTVLSLSVPLHLPKPHKESP